MPYVRALKTASGAIAVQIVHSCHRGARQIEHIGSAHDDAELELLKAVARQRLAAGQGLLDLGPGFGAGQGGPLPIMSSRMGCLLDALSRGHDVLGFGRAAAGDEVFRDLVLARIIEPVSKLDSLRVLEEAKRPLIQSQYRPPGAVTTVPFGANFFKTERDGVSRFQRRGQPSASKTAIGSR